jgi:hypothetical protein
MPPMAKVAIVDYKRVASLFHKTISVDIPEELVARKGNSRSGRARCRRAQAALTETVHSELKKAGRRPFRGNVATHLRLSGVSLDRPDEARRTVKAILDSLEGPVYPDDRAVSLLDVVMAPGPREATIDICSERQYADAFDVLAGVSADRDATWDDDDASVDDPWRWTGQSMQDELRLEFAEEHLADWEAEGGECEWPELRSKMIKFNQDLIREHRRDAQLSRPYVPTDRPGPPSLGGRIWIDGPGLPHPARIFLPAPNGSGSWATDARKAFAAHLNHWWPLTAPLRDEPVALDIAIGHRASGGSDVDNLAHRVIRAFLESAADLPTPLAYRAYRRHGDDEAIVVQFHAARRAQNLRRLLSGSSFAASGLHPDPDGPVYRRRPLDDEAYKQLRALDVGTFS